MTKTKTNLAAFCLRCEVISSLKLLGGFSIILVILWNTINSSETCTCILQVQTLNFYILFKMHRLVDKCFDFKHFTSPAQVWWSPFHCTSYYFLHLSQSPSVSQTQPRCNKALTPGSSLKIKTMLTSKHPPRMTHTTYIFPAILCTCICYKPIIGSTQIHCICILNTVENLKKTYMYKLWIMTEYLEWKQELATCWNWKSTFHFPKNRKKTSYYTVPVVIP